MSITDPIFAAIERHRVADAAYDDALERDATETIKGVRSNRERDALIAFLRTKPETLAGGLAALRYLADYAENNGDGLFGNTGGELRSAGAAFFPMIADAIEAVVR